MRVTIDGSPEELAALVLAAQELEAGNAVQIIPGREEEDRLDGPPRDE